MLDFECKSSRFCDGTLDKAKVMANHASTRTTQHYDRRHEEMTLDEGEKIGI
jgi:hypothetical protein